MKQISLFVLSALLLCACGGHPKKAAQPAVPSAEDFAKMQELYQATEDDHGSAPLAKWQYVDLDGDGINEVWMRDADEEYGAFFTFNGDAIDLIGVETDQFGAYTRACQDGKGYFCKGGPAGGPSYYTEVVTVKNSRVGDRFTLLEVYGDIDSASLNGEEIDEEKAAAFRDALPESVELVPGEWNELPA